MKERQTNRSTGGVNWFLVYAQEKPVVAKRMEQLQRFYRHVTKEQLDQCLEKLSLDRALDRTMVENVIVDHAVENLHLDGVASYWKLHSQRYNKTVYLFGEYHSNIFTCDKTTPQCMFPNLLKEFIMAHDIPIDVFAELQFVDPGYEMTVGHPYDRWESLLQNFIHCFQRVKTECPYRNNVRFHYANFRGTQVHPITSYMTISEKINQMVGIMRLPVIPVRQERMIRLAQEIIGIVETKRLQPGQLLVPKLRKQIDAIKDPLVRDKILERYDPRQVEDVVKNLLPELRTIANGGDYLLDVGDLWHTVGQINHMDVIMDLYLMARMFRSFTPVPDQHSQDATTVFIYVGDAHAQEYSTFLIKSLGFTETDYKQVKVVEPTDACLPVPDQFKVLFQRA
jgi:hypothetical protein